MIFLIDCCTFEFLGGASPGYFHSMDSHFNIENRNREPLFHLLLQLVVKSSLICNVKLQKFLKASNMPLLPLTKALSLTVVKKEWVAFWQAEKKK